LVSRRDGAERQPRDMVRNTAVVEGLIADRVRASDGRISAKRLLPIVEGAGYTGSARNLRPRGGGGESDVEAAAAHVSSVGAGAG